MKLDQKTVFFILLLLLSSTGYYLLLLPLATLSSIRSTLSGYPDFFIVSEFILPVFSSIALYFVFKKAKKQSIFFLVTLIIFLTTYGFPFLNTILDPRATEEMAIYFLFVAFFAFCATVLWKKFVSRKQISKLALFSLPFLAIAFFELGQINARSIIADYLNFKTNYNFNIYFYDVGGFTILFYNTIISISSLLILALSNTQSKRKKLE